MSDERPITAPRGRVTQREVRATMRTAERNAAFFEAHDLPVSAARCRARVESCRARLAEMRAGE